MTSLVRKRPPSLDVLPGVLDVPAARPLVVTAG
jgi:hypothetical protein